ncbi:MAG: ribose 5-phosphate isomerase B [Candidatus Eisenbacteria bacterium]|nr:ribose 5-phosphate isomerase B [Candidatus Eisenbacteria bacterium]
MEGSKFTPDRIRKVVREVLEETLADEAGAKGGTSGKGAGRAQGSTGPTGRAGGQGRAAGSGQDADRAPVPAASGGTAAPAEASWTRVKASDSGTLALGADHGGFAFKEQLKKYLEQELGVAVKDYGTHGPEPVDYPDFALAVARAVASGECQKGIVVDTMGIGSSIAANKVKGVRAALCHDVETARNSRAHNDANVLALGSKVVNSGHARRIVREWLATPFEGGRHAGRVQKIIDAERG